MFSTIAVYYLQKPYVEKEHQSTCCDFFSIDRRTYGRTYGQTDGHK